MGFLRLLLAISVVLAHSAPIGDIGLVGGPAAVQAFYIISGFYMSLILNEKYVWQNRSYRLFITNRLLRLYPLYWVLAAFTVLFAVYILFKSNGIYAGPLQSYFDYWAGLQVSSLVFLAFTNVFLLFQDVVMFLGLDPASGSLYFTTDFLNTKPSLYSFLLLPQAWSIGVEITFYLVAPLLVRRPLKVIVPIILLSFALRFVLYRYGLNHDPWTYRFFPCELAFFLLGNVSYRIYKQIERKNVNVNYLYLAFGVMLLFTAVYSKYFFSGKTYLYFTGFFLTLPFLFEHTKRMKFDAFIGELSYPVYISHLLILGVLDHFQVPVIGGKGLTLTLCTVAFSILLNELVSKPIEKYRQSRVKHQAKPEGATHLQPAVLQNVGIN